MTTRLAPLAALLLVGSLAACGADDQAADPAPAEDTAAETPAEETPADATDDATGDTDDGSYTMAEVEQNASAESCWTVIDGEVYDVTEWIDQHPGGPERIQGLCGTDGTDQFEAQHDGRSGPENQLESFKIGDLED